MAAQRVILPALPPDQRAACEAATFPQVYAELVKAGTFSALDFWDSLPWLSGPGDWTPWRSFVAAVFGLPMTAPELSIYRRCTGRVMPPSQQVREAWMPVGRRARKSATAAVIAAYVGAFWDHSKYLAKGERAVIPIMAKDKDDAQQIKRYIETIFTSTPLSFLLAKEPTTEEISLTNQLDFRIRAAKITAGRGFAVPLWILDEIAFFRTDDSANPDTEILRGLRPAQATVPRPLGLALSSPYARRGELWANHKAHYGHEHDPVLVWEADTLTMHPGNPEVAAHVADEFAKDATSALSEYGKDGKIRFREDVQQFVPEAVVEAAIMTGVTRVPPVPGVQYVGFADPSGGTSDSMTLAIAHWEAGKVTLDVVEEAHAPFIPSDVVGSFVALCQDYGVTVLEGDRYAGIWPAAEFSKKGRIRSSVTRAVFDSKGDALDAGVPTNEQQLLTPVIYHLSDNTKREIYKNFLPLLTSHTAKLLDLPRLKAQLEALDRRTAQGGDIIDHPPGGHDDVANVAAGALLRADRMRMPAKTPPPPPPKTTRDILKQQFAESMKPKKKSKVNPW